MAGAALWSQWDEARLSFKLLVEDVGVGFDALVADARKVAAEVKGFFTGAMGSVMEFFGFVDAAATSKSQTSIDLSIAAPKGVVKSIKSKTSGDSAGLDLGVNLAESM